MCHMQLNFSCKRQLQNPKFLVVRVSFVQLALGQIELMLGFVGVGIAPNRAVGALQQKVSLYTKQFHQILNEFISHSEFIDLMNGDQCIAPTFCSSGAIMACMWPLNFCQGLQIMEMLLWVYNTMGRRFENGCVCLYSRYGSIQ